jgi:hypothetical protein
MPFSYGQLAQCLVVVPHPLAVGDNGATDGSTSAAMRTKLRVLQDKSAILFGPRGRYAMARCMLRSDAGGQAS